jgi:hypothetical protein
MRNIFNDNTGEMWILSFFPPLTIFRRNVLQNPTVSSSRLPSSTSCRTVPSNSGASSIHNQKRNHNTGEKTDIGKVDIDTEKQDDIGNTNGNGKNNNQLNPLFQREDLVGSNPMGNAQPLVELSVHLSQSDFPYKEVCQGMDLVQENLLSANVLVTKEQVTSQQLHNNGLEKKEKEEEKEEETKSSFIQTTLLSDNSINMMNTLAEISPASPILNVSPFGLETSENFRNFSSQISTLIKQALSNEEMQEEVEED